MAVLGLFMDLVGLGVLDDVCFTLLFVSVCLIMGWLGLFFFDVTHYVCSLCCWAVGLVVLMCVKLSFIDA